MSAPKDVPMLYAASCNPPRRAKRQRTGSLGGTDASPIASTPSSSPQQRRASGRPPILPKKPAADHEYAPRATPQSDSGSDEEDDYNPGRDVAPTPKRRGRKPGTMSRTARESLRKLNHSRIEKARRTKINETLATLSNLIGDRDRVLLSRSTEVSEAPVEETGKKGKGKTEEKEFKLDVLVKTVEYMQDLIARVQVLECKMCPQCRTAGDDAMEVPPSPKRRRPEDAVEEVQRSTRRMRLDQEEDSYIGDDEHGLGAAEEEQPSPMPFVNPSSRATASPRLPPIASWLPHPYVDPSSLITASPSTAPVRSPPNAQLPSPPPSGRFRPPITLANMPALTLPAPAHPITPGGPHRTSSPKMLPPRQQQRTSISASPTVSPTWTPEDETAASLLLQMSSKPRSSSISSTSGNSTASSFSLSKFMPITPREEVPKDRMLSGSIAVVTPGALLGMRD
ncbi:hypothetical protein C8Q80DRAFT_1249818 [Daedaleopsis nitida]|nr:hypothetical protein C8Q80DRAFT_1249818 [Daedaleopsis nitida]